LDADSYYPIAAINGSPLIISIIQRHMQAEA
jgi:hypothetical protein